MVPESIAARLVNDKDHALKEVSTPQKKCQRRSLQWDGGI
jgi:hypothetical protein